MAEGLRHSLGVNDRWLDRHYLPHSHLHLVDTTILQIRKPGCKVTQPVSNLYRMPTAFPGSKLNIVPPWHRNPCLPLAFLSLLYLIHCLYRVCFSSPPPPCFLEMPHLQWKVSRGTKASYSSHTEGLTKVGQYSRRCAATGVHTDSARLIKQLSVLLRSLCSWASAAAASYCTVSNSLLNPGRTVLWAERRARVPREEYPSSGALEGILSCPEWQEGEKELQKCLRKNLWVRLHPVTQPRHSKLRFTEMQNQNVVKKAFHSFNCDPPPAILYL